MIYMDNSDLVLGFLLLLLLVILILVCSAYLAEWYTEKALQSYARFQSTKGKLQKLENDLDREASKWPIYARPVLFTSVDKNTQRTFGMAHRALMEAKRIEKEFPSIPLRPSEAFEMFSPMECARRILYCDAVIQLEVEFAKWLDQLEDGKKTLNQHYKAEGRTLDDVKGKLEALKARLSAAEKKVAERAHGEAFNETVGWAINYAQIGTQASTEKLEVPQDKELLHYAIADTFIRLTNYLLDHFDLYAMDVSFSEKFILDRFENRLKDFEINLRKVIEAKAKVEDEGSPAKEISPAATMRQSISGTGTKFTAQTTLQIRQATYQQAANAIEIWDDVKLLDSLLLVLKEKLERASSSFSFFLKTHAIYLELTQKIAVPNIPRLQEGSLKLETECETYWGGFATFPLHWNEALRESSLPTVEFNAAKELFISQIAYYLRSDSKIKQSELTGIISKMTCYLVKVEKGVTSYKKLSLHLQVHKDARVKVEARLENNGSSGKLVRDMELLTKDYSDANHLECAQNREEYNEFVVRAKKITGANFPAMLGELNVFEGKCWSLITRHWEEIKVLRQQCETISMRLRTQRNTIQQFKAATPRLKYDFPTIETKVHAALQHDYTKNGNVQWLEGYLQEANRVIGDADQSIAQLNAEWQTFVAAEESAFALLTQHQALLYKYQEVFSVSWAWVRIDSADLLTNAKRKMEQLSTPLSRNRDPQLKTSVEEAVWSCQKVKEELEMLNSTTLGRLAEIHQQQDEFQKSFDALMNMVDRPLAPIDYMFRSKPKVPAKLRELCFLATQVDERRQARSFLSAADAYFQKQLTEEDAEKLIQEYHINYGLIIEEQNNQAGATVNNAGRDMYSN